MKKALNDIKEKQPAQYGKSSVIALAIAAVLFLAALFFIYSKDILNGAGDIFWEFGEEKVEFEKASVIDIVSEDYEPQDTADNEYRGSQELAVIVKSGRYKGERMTVNNYFTPLSGVPVAVGDSVTLTVKTRTDGTYSATVYEFNRIPIIAVFLLLFFAVILLVGRSTGLKSLAGLIITVICLFMILIPLLLKGAPTVLTTFVVCAYIAFVGFTILGGIRRKTMSAFMGTVAGTFLAMLLGVSVQYLAKISGYRLEDAEALLQLKYVGVPLRIKGLLSAGVIISALGAVMDVSMSISSALEEVYAANPSLTRRQLYKSGMNIGRDLVGTMTNTLILAFLGSEFTLIIFLYSRGLTFYHLFSTALVSLETISGLSSSMGMILAIPLTALISSALIKKKQHHGEGRTK